MKRRFWFLNVLMACTAVLQVSNASSQTVEYIHTDSLGTPIAVTDASQRVVERSEYSPYGDLLNRADSDAPAYAGHVQDAATGFIYMQQRYYDPALGRFLSVDPVTVSAATERNKYWYGNNSPYRYIDPDGRQTCSAGYCDGGTSSDQAPDPELIRQQAGEAAPNSPAKSVEPTNLEPVRVTAARSPAEIIGRAQRSSKTPTHASTSQRIAELYSRMENVARVYLNKSLRTVLNDRAAPNIRPDVVVETEDGDVHNIEVRSAGQTEAELFNKLSGARSGMNGIGGQDIVVDPDPVIAPEFMPDIPPIMLEP